MSMIEFNMVDMNLVNMATAVHRIGKLAANKPTLASQIQGNPVFDALLLNVAFLLRSVDRRDVEVKQSLSNIAWSLATLRYPHAELVELLAEFVVANPGAFKPFELSTILWAFAKLTTIDSDLANYQQPTPHCPPPRPNRKVIM